ncbi:hypothetical protein GQR58_001994 [Nymphon striatum]|nr:hypothetical protein GQR58_001994 [Nymphon striatum]
MLKYRFNEDHRKELEKLRFVVVDSEEILPVSWCRGRSNDAPAVWHAAAVRICRVKITLAYSSNVLVVPGFIICTIAAPSRMTLVTTGASDLALESSSMQFRHFGQFPLRQALPFPSCQPLSGHPCFLLQMGFQVPQAQPQVRSHLSHLPSGLQLFSIEIDI